MAVERLVNGSGAWWKTVLPRPPRKSDLPPFRLDPCLALLDILSFTVFFELQVQIKSSFCPDRNVHIIFEYGQAEADTGNDFSFKLNVTLDIGRRFQIKRCKRNES